MLKRIGLAILIVLIVIMMVAGTTASRDQERRWLPARSWIVPSLLATLLAAFAWSTVAASL